MVMKISIHVQNCGASTKMQKNGGKWEHFQNIFENQQILPYRRILFLILACKKYDGKIWLWKFHDTFRIVLRVQNQIEKIILWTFSKYFLNRQILISFKIFSLMLKKSFFYIFSWPHYNIRGAFKNWWHLGDIWDKKQQSHICQ